MHRALGQLAKPHAPSCVVSRAKRYNPDLSRPTPKPGSAEEDAENLREFVKEAEDEAVQDEAHSRSRKPMSVPVCGVAMTSDSSMSVTEVAQVTLLTCTLPPMHTRCFAYADCHIAAPARAVAPTWHPLTSGVCMLGSPSSIAQHGRVITINAQHGTRRGKAGRCGRPRTILSRRRAVSATLQVLGYAE